MRTLLLAFLFASIAPLAAQGTQRLTYADTAKPIRWEGELPRVAWASDGRHVELREGQKVFWVDPASGDRQERPAGGADAGNDGDGEPGSAAAPQRVAVVFEGDLWLDEAAAPAGRGAGRGRGRPRGRPSPDAVRLTTDGAAAGAKEEAHVSPDGAFGSFVRQNDLYVVSAAEREVWRVTEDGGPELFHGKLDWVYQEELYGRGDFQAHWWSPTGGRCAFLSLDEAPVREFTVVDHVPTGYLDRERTVVTEVSNYPKAGDPNPNARLSIAHAGARRVVPVDLAKYPKDVLVVRVDWTPDAATLLVTLQDRIQTWAELCAVDPDTGAVTTWIREQSPTWVNRPESPRWLADGTFLWLSERTGYQHVYRYRKGGELLSALTAGEWQVRAIVRVDEARGLLWFEGTRDGATGRHLYRVGFDGEGPIALTPGVGTHQFDLNADGSFVLDRWSAMDQPTIVRVLDGNGGGNAHELAKADKGAAKDYAFSEKRRATIAARDGYPLDASVMLPPDWQQGRRYPVYLPTYSGPDAPSVRDRWGHSTNEQFLAQQGFVILQVNVRSASGRGQVHTGTCYRQLGVQELRDLEDAVDHVVANFGGDPARVAISGWSYGGFMAAYALTHSTKFALGLAGAGVHDWRLYDTIYTERYMRTPQENPAGYDASSVIKAAKDLHGHLVLIHGTMDDNVHMQNTMQLLWGLESAGKQDIELMLYPRSRHGLNPSVSAHSREYQWLRLQRLLDAPAVVR